MELTKNGQLRELFNGLILKRAELKNTAKLHYLRSSLTGTTLYLIKGFTLCYESLMPSWYKAQRRAEEDIRNGEPTLLQFSRLHSVKNCKSQYRCKSYKCNHHTMIHVPRNTEGKSQSTSAMESTQDQNKGAIIRSHGSPQLKNSSTQLNLLATALT